MLANVLPARTVRALSRPRPVLAFASVVVTWAMIALAIVASERWFHPLLYVVTVMWIGNQQHSLLIQMHDGAHHRIAKNRLVNDVIGELFCAWPLFFRMQAYRENHLLHHKYPNTEKDPDFRPGRFPKTRKAMIRSLLLDLFALNTFEQLGELKRLKKKTDLGTTLLRVVFYGAVAAALTYFGVWRVYLLYWIVPVFTWLKVILRIRAIADHAGVERNAAPFDTRTIVPNLFDRMFLAPRNCTYHLGHHFYPSVPWFNLKRLHRELMKNETIRAEARITRGCYRLFLEFP